VLSEQIIPCTTGISAKLAYFKESYCLALNKELNIGNILG
jgi:hypothetical protein